jgi:uncharacterized protein (DUF302 family)
MDSTDDRPGLRTGRLGERDVVLSMSHDRAVEHVRDAVVEAGFDVPVQFSPSDRINAAREDQVPPYTVLGLGVPAAAAHALDAGGRRIGALFPCRIVVWEAGHELQHVYHLNTMLLARDVGLAPDSEAWGALVAQLEDMVKDAFSALGDGNGDTNGGETWGRSEPRDGSEPGTDDERR